MQVQPVICKILKMNVIYFCTYLIFILLLLIINGVCVTIVLGFFFFTYFLGAINFNVYQFTTDNVYMYMIAVKCIIFQVMLNFIIYASTKCRYLITGNLIKEFKITCRSIHVHIIENSGFHLI